MEIGTRVIVSMDKLIADKDNAWLLNRIEVVNHIQNKFKDLAEDAHNGPRPEDFGLMPFISDDDCAICC